MGDNRSHVNFYDDEEIDIEELTGITPQPKVTDEQKDYIAEVAKSSGFPSREPVQKKQRKRSPYVIQKNIKMRVGMAELLAKITAKKGVASDQETLELAIGVLIEKEGYDTLKAKYEKLTKDA